MRDSNNPVSAPQISDAEQCYKLWKKQYRGSMNDFYRFMVTPSAQRNRFINDAGYSISAIGEVTTLTVKAPDEISGN